MPKSKATTPPEDDPDTVPGPDEGQTEETPQEAPQEARSALDDPEHPLHHLRNA